MIIYDWLDDGICFSVSLSHRELFQREEGSEVFSHNHPFVTDFFHYFLTFCGTNDSEVSQLKDEGNHLPQPDRHTAHKLQQVSQVLIKELISVY